MSWRSAVATSALGAVGNRKFDVTRQVLDHTGLVEPGAGPAVSRANARFVCSYYARFARLAAGGSRRGLVGSVDVDAGGEEHLAAALEPGRGVVLLSVHLGDFDLIGAWLSDRGVVPVVITEPLAEVWRERLFTAVRQRAGIVVRDRRGTTTTTVENDLRSGRAVLVMLDRRPTGATLTSRILGRPSVTAAGAASVASRTGASLLPIAAWRDPAGTPRCWIGEPVVASDTSDAAVAMTAAARRLGDLIRAHPDQWHVPADAGQLSWSTAAVSAAAPSISGRGDQAARQEVGRTPT